MFDYNKLRSLYIPEEFGDSCDCETDCIGEVSDEICGDVTIETGATMFVIIDKDPANTKVAKIPFNGEFDYDEYNDIETFRPFRYNYAGRTEQFYEEAEEAEIEAIFAECKLFGHTANGTPIYIQDKVTTVYEMDLENMPHASENTKEKVKEIVRNNIYSYWRRFNREWLCNAVEYYGLEFMGKFIDFCEEFRLDDFHNGNLGYRRDGSPCILDWAGYLE